MSTRSRRPARARWTSHATVRQSEVLARDAQVVSRREEIAQLTAQLRAHRTSVCSAADLSQDVACIVRVAIFDRDFARRREARLRRIRRRDEGDSAIDDSGLSMDERVRATRYDDVDRVVESAADDAVDRFDGARPAIAMRVAFKRDAHVNAAVRRFVQALYDAAVVDAVKFSIDRRRRESERFAQSGARIGTDVHGKSRHARYSRRLRRASTTLASVGFRRQESPFSRTNW